MAPAAFTLRLADALGALLFLLLRRRRAVAVDNVRQSGLVTGAAGARRLARRSFQSFARMVAETAILRYRLTPDNWRDHVELRCSPAAEALLQDQGQGAQVASGHLGNWEVAARAVSLRKPISVVYRPFNNPYLDRSLNGDRGGDQLHLISKFKASPTRFLKILAAGELLAIMIDQHAGDRGGRVRVNFFGRPAWTTRSVALMALTTRVPVLVAGAIRTGPLRFRVEVDGPLPCPRTGDREQDVQAFTQELTDRIEAMARSHPEQYMWGHRRWRP